MSVIKVQVFDERQQIIVRPDEIRVGDWMRDLGTLRQVASVEEVSDEIRPGGEIFVLRFDPMPGVEDLMLTIPSAVDEVIVWRAA